MWGPMELHIGVSPGAVVGMGIYHSFPTSGKDPLPRSEECG